MVNEEVEVAIIDDSWIIFAMKGNKEMENYLEELWGSNKDFHFCF